ncbi:lipid A biosynthesis acyltransferase [Pseudenhygromyxa sp. WMMC2535]|uniref:LpxL/LpxP family acyltransferase n=1 Tax=Pseudenhygromyxa sp. WMMC2535 TaxID=2712867 RepID=UPI00155648E0|nr:lipid A biosynthesis acyltransferase [Pseudenhygromyxa sp. WMMC2535]NVB42528.1 lipid A biosynthesis acyltransferase [Pseudenhygromyxa sp. WMMC2535]
MDQGLAVPEARSAELSATPGSQEPSAGVDALAVHQAEADAKAREREAWLARRERGSRVGIRALLVVTRVLGRRGGHLLLRVIIFYFTLFAPKPRRASRAWLARVRGESSFWAAYRHFLRFAQVALDRVFFVQGRLEPFEFDRQGTQLMHEQVHSGRGAILLGAHFGSFEAMRAAGRSSNLPINILAHNQNARMIATFLDEVSGGRSQVRVIEIDPEDRTYILTVKERIEAGELVAVLGDRLGLNDRWADAEFFGAPARFPTGPYIMASVLRCPIFTVFGVFEAPNRYRLRCEPFAERVELPRGKRDEALAAYAQRFAARLEHYAGQAPDNWFNFYDFWYHPPTPPGEPH